MTNNQSRLFNTIFLLLGQLTIVFVTLKLLNVIVWRWFWVISPLWIPFLLNLIAVLVIILIPYIKTLKKK